MTVEYEWICECEDEAGDVVEVFHGAWEEVRAWRAANQDYYHQRIALVRDTEEGRTWAYITGDRLPERFEDASGCPGVKVPARFFRESRAR